MKQYSLTSHLLETPRQDNRIPKGFLAKSPGLNAFTDEGQSKSGLAATELKPVTKTIQKLHRNKRKYINTPNKVRLELIDAVHKHGEKIKFAAKRLGINYSSAKAICQVYKREGRSDRILIKKRMPKQLYIEPKQEKHILTTTSGFKSEEKFIIKEKNLLKKYETLKDDRFSLLEPYKAFCKDEKHLGSDKHNESIFKGIPSQGTLYQSLQEAKQGSHIINQTINQNNIFVTVQPNYFSQIEKFNFMAPGELAHTNIHSVHNPASFGLPNIPSHQELISKLLDSSIPQQNLKSEFVNNQRSQLMNLEKQLMQAHQNPLPQYYGLINPAMNLLPKSLDIQLTSQYGQGIYYPKF